MFSRSSWLHLRIPFSFFLLPIFLFSLAISPNYDEPGILWTFLIIHFLLYPASNGYNSYFDKDEGSIGGLKNPPPVKHGLYYLSLLFDLIAVVLGFILVNVTFSVMLFIYGLVSKAYSHPSVRIKKYPWSGFLVTGVFQGLFTVVMCFVGINDYPLAIILKSEQVVFAGLLACGMLWANYPMTQVYQHNEDARRGDRTFSRMLGIRGTFYFVGGIFALVTIGFISFFYQYYHIRHAILFVLSLLPVIIFFSYWFVKVLKNEEAANYSNTMLLNVISSICLNVFFIYLFLDTSHVLQLFT